MTAQQMHENFERKLAELHKVEKSFTSVDVSSFLHKSEENILFSLYSDDNVPGKSYFEANEKTRTELANLIRNHAVSSTGFVTGASELHSNAFFVDMPSDYLYAIKEECTLTYTDCNGNTTSRITKVVPKRYDEYLEDIGNPYAKPYKELVWRLDYGVTAAKRHEIVHSSDNTVTAYRMRYLKKPRDININTGVDSEMDSSLHERIVDGAVMIALQTLGIDINKKAEQ